MGKKAANKKPAEAPAAKADPAAPSSSALPSTSYLDNLTPEEREAEEQRKEQRRKKAEEAQKQTLEQNRRREQWEKEKEKVAREQQRQDKAWQQQLLKDKARANADGVLEAQLWDDGEYWVHIGGMDWKNVQGPYFCPLCSKQLHESSLGAHLDSDAHKKKVEWQRHESGLPVAAAAAAPAAVASVARPAALPSTSFDYICRPGAPLPTWQEVGADGSLRCKPCNKVIDECHVVTADHKGRLERWLAAEELQRVGYPEPEEPHLAWIPCDPADAHSERWLKCLLCDKWVQDETSHTGTYKDAAPVGSKDHLKNLRNNPPGSPWYKEKVVQVRRQWHPPRTVLQQPAPGPPLPPGWAVAHDAEGRAYYYNGAHVQWERPTATDAPAAAAAAAVGEEISV